MECNHSVCACDSLPSSRTHSIARFTTRLFILLCMQLRARVSAARTQRQVHNATRDRRDRGERLSPRFGRRTFVSKYLLVRGGLNGASAEEAVGPPGPSPLGRSCVNPLREAHTKLVPLSFCFFLSSFPVSLFSRKAIKTVRTIFGGVSIRVFSRTPQALIRRFYEYS